MIGGFAMVAWQAEYGVSGVRDFQSSITTDTRSIDGSAALN